MSVYKMESIQNNKTILLANVLDIKKLVSVSFILFLFLVVDANNEFELRLRNYSGLKGEGRVEVFRRGETAGVWGNICDNDWDKKDALVACRQLGFGNVGFPIDGKRTNRRYGTGVNVDFFYTEFNCNGSENALRDCPHVTYSSKTGRKCTNEPGNEMTAGLFCFADFDVRLVSGKSATEGRLELFYNGDWTNVRNQEFTDETASVACMQVQDGEDKPYTNGIIVSGRYGTDEGRCQFSDFDCRGNETHISDCKYRRSDTAEICKKIVALRCDNPCSISPCNNGGLCEPTVGGSLICHCRPGYSGQLCTISEGGITNKFVDLNTVTFETIVLATTFGLIGLFLILTLLTTIISKFAFNQALERIIFDADQELESKDLDNFESREIGSDQYYEEGDRERDDSIEGFGEDENEYIEQYDYEDHENKLNTSNEQLGSYDERFEGSYDVKGT